MKRALKKRIVAIVIYLCYLWGCIWYDRRYLRGKFFSREYFSQGWVWILQYWFSQKIMRKNGHIPFPVPPYVSITNINNLQFDLNDMRNFHMIGSYFQCIDGKIIVGKGSYIAQGVGIITTNHDINNLSVPARGKDVIIGERCWIGMNAVLLPGVTLGVHTIVGAGSVVTKSFPEGECILVGNPAHIIRRL